MKNRCYLFSLVLLTISLFMFSGCVSLRMLNGIPSRNLSDPGIKSEKSLYNFFMDQNPKANKKLVKRLARYYVEEGQKENINSDCAFVQMCLETGFLRFGGLVTPQMHNYCGLGSIDKNHPGESFKTEREGVRAHIQHLHAYATTSNVKLKNTCIDKRYKYVTPRGKAPSIYELSGTWAMDPNYSIKLDSLLSKLSNY